MNKTPARPSWIWQTWHRRAVPSIHLVNSINYKNFHWLWQLKYMLAERLFLAFCILFNLIRCDIITLNGILEMFNTVSMRFLMPYTVLHNNYECTGTHTNVNKLQGIKLGRDISDTIKNCLGCGFILLFRLKQLLLVILLHLPEMRSKEIILAKFLT